MGRQSRVDDFLNIRRLLQCLRDSKSVDAVLLHPQMQGLDAPLSQPTVIRARYGTDGVLQEPQFVSEFGMLGRKDQGAHDDIRMAVDVFCKRVHDNVSALEEWGLVEWREESVIDQDKRGRRVVACE